MADNGVTTNELTRVSLVDEVVGNRDQTTVRISVEALAAQMIASGPWAESQELALAAAEAAAQSEENSAANAAAAQNLANVGMIAAPGGPVACATTANVTLSGEQALDGVLTNASRVLVKNQTNPAQNGPYVTGPGAWVRATDMDAAAEFQYKSVYVTAGALNAGKTFYTPSAVTTVGTDAVVWVEVSSANASLTEVTRFRRRSDGPTDRLAYQPANLDNVTSSSVTQTGSTRYLANASGDCRFSFGLFAHQVGATTVDAVMFVSSGTPSALTLDQRTSADALIAATAVVLTDEKNGVWAARGVVIQPTFARFRLRVQNSGVGPLDFEAPIITPAGTQSVRATTKSGPAAAALLASTVANSFTDFWEAQSITQSVLTGSTLSGKTVALPVGAKCSVQINMASFAPSDSIMMVFRASGPFAAKAFDIIPHTGLSGGAGLTFQTTVRGLGNDWYVATRPNAQAAGGAQAAYADVVFDNRSNTGFVQSGAVTFEDCWLGRNATEVPSIVTAPAVVLAALGKSGALTLFVSSAGSDAATGTRSAPLATIAEAKNRGASRIMVRKSATPHRHSGLTFSGVELVGYSESGDTTERAKVWASTNLAAGSWIATAADPNVYFYPTTTHPRAVWENVGNVLTRFGQIQTDPLGVRASFAQESLSLATVAAGAGRWWHGNSTEGVGIYLRPSADTFAGKSYEISTANQGITISGPNNGFSGVDVWGGRDEAVYGTYCAAWAHFSTFGYCGTSDGVSILNNASWLDRGYCGYTNAGDDGLNLNGGGSTLVMLGGSWSAYNIGDGVAPHGAGNAVWIQAMRIFLNGKQGFVSIGTGTYEFVDCDFRGNTDLDFLLDIGALTVATTVRLQGCQADECKISATTASYISGTITDHRGPLNLKADIAVQGHRVIKSGRSAFDMDGGVISLRDFYHSGNLSALDVSGGTLTVDSGQILRNTTGIIQTGGTLVLDATAPVNLYGNTTAFSGVSGGNQALTVAIAAA